MLGGCRCSIRFGARGGEIFVTGPAAREQVTRLRLREPRFTRGDARTREAIVEARDHLTRLDRVALVDIDRDDPALGLEPSLTASRTGSMRPGATRTAGRAISG